MIDSSTAASPDSRQSQVAVLTKLAELAARTSDTQEYAPLLLRLASHLGEAFTFLVVGEVNSGKSSLINALAEESLSPVGITPTTSLIQVFKYGAESKVLRVDDTIEEIFSPTPLLGEIHLVDTPGTNSIEDHHQAITEGFLPLADLVLFVFPAHNPWGATAWEFLEKISKDWGKKVVFCLQQSDRCSPEELREVQSKLRSTCEERFQQLFPVAVASAKWAMEGSLANSGIPELREVLFQRLTEDSGRREQEHTTLLTAQSLLEQIERSLQRSQASLECEQQTIVSHDRETYQQRERTRHKFQNILHNLDHRYRQLKEEGSAFLSQQLGLKATLLSIFNPSETPAKLERRIAVRLLEEARSALSSATQIVEDDLNRLWKLSLPDHKLPDWKTQRSQLFHSIEETLREFVKDLNLQPKIERRVRLRKGALLASVLVAAACGSVGALLASSETQPLLLGAAAGVLLLGLASGQWIKASGRRAVQKVIEASRDDLQQRTLQCLDLEVNTYFHQFISQFSLRRRSVERRREDREPSIQQLESQKAELQRLLTLTAPSSQA